MNWIWLLILAIAAVCCGVQLIAYGRLYSLKSQPFQRVGASFSIWQARWLAGEWGGPGVGPAWEESLQQIVAIKGLNVIRLSVPWKNIEQEGWGQIDRAISICKEASVGVVLVAGIKTPRWPEAYVPETYLAKAVVSGQPTLNTQNQEFRTAALNWVKTVITRYNDQPLVEAFQIENEPLEAFGNPKKSVPLDFLQEEVALAKSLTNKPLIVTMGAGMTELFLYQVWHRRKLLKQLVSLPVQSIGLNIYQSGWLGGWVHFYAAPCKWLFARWMVGQIKQSGKSAIISELQAEPWESSPSRIDYKHPRGNTSITPQSYKRLCSRAQKIGFSEAWLWGAEFQTACKAQKNPSWFQATEDLLK